MTYFGITNANGLQWIGEAGSGTEAVRILMNDVGADSFVEPRVWAIPEPPEGWAEAGPLGWLCEWVEDQGQRVEVDDQVRVDGTIFGWSCVTDLMDCDIVEEMAAAGIYAQPLTAGGHWHPLPLDQYLAEYRQRHAAKFEGEVFKVG